MKALLTTIIACLPVLSSAAEIEFNRDIRSILSDKCVFCHGPDEEERQADLRLDIEDAATEYAIVPGDPEASELIHRITTTDPDLKMPPLDSGKTLTTSEIAKLRVWIASGAKYQPFWAYVAPVKRPPPAVCDDMKSWPLNWIDHFILERLTREVAAVSGNDELAAAKQVGDVLDSRAAA